MQPLVRMVVAFNSNGTGPIPLTATKTGTIHPSDHEDRWKREVEIDLPML